MEEADAIGDYIAIMNEGQLQCFGTPMSLKKKNSRFWCSRLCPMHRLDGPLLWTEAWIAEHLSQFADHGAHLILLIEENQDIPRIVKKIKNKLREFISNVECKGPDGNQVQFLLSDGEYGPMFEYLELNKKSLHIENISFANATLEDVFLKWVYSVDCLKQANCVLNSFLAPQFPPKKKTPAMSLFPLMNQWVSVFCCKIPNCNRFANILFSAAF